MIRNRLFIVLAILCLVTSVASDERQPPPCATTCHEEQCDSTGIRYGKFCGVGHGGCEGEKPCDSIDACCKAHDSCVTKAGLFANKCHQSFIDCLNKREKRKDGFSQTCPYSLVVPVMRDSIKAVMGLSAMFGGAFGNQDEEL